MDANWQYGEEGRWWQIGHSSCFRVGDAHSTDVSGLFSLLFIRFFLSPSPLKPCWYCTCLIMMKHVPFSPNLSAVAWFVLCNDLRDLQAWRKCKLAFSSLGWRCGGWVYNNKYQNEYQMAEPCSYYTCLMIMKHVPISPNLYTTALTVLHVMFTVTFKREGPARLQLEL
jgi:hypothetical protein